MNKETKQAIKLLGGCKGIAYLFDVTSSTGYTWSKKGVPPKYVPTVSHFTGIAREDLRPDIYGVAKIPQDIMDRFNSGFPCRSSKPLKPEIAERDNDIYLMHKSGSTLQEIGDKYGFTREYARQILGKYGINGDTSGFYLRAFSNAVEKGRSAREKKDKRCAEKWGCTSEQYDCLRAMENDYAKTPIRAFVEQRRNASVRGIKWGFTLWGWWRVWADSGKWDRRGRNKGDYVMARIEDIGGYEKENVEIITNVQNSKDYYAIYGSEHRQKVIDGRAAAAKQ